MTGPATIAINQTHAGFFIMCIVIGYLIGSPYYLFPSGTPQPADMFIALGMGLFFCRNFCSSTHLYIPKIYGLAMLFASYTFLINGIYWFYLKDTYFMLSSFYYIYNAALFIFFASVIKLYKEEALRWIYIAVVISILAQVLVLIIDPSMRGSRATGTFVNPNQLAYWSWFCGAILVVLKINKGFKLIDFFFLLCIGYIQTMSLSKAGIICYLLLWLSLPFSSVLPNRYKLTILVTSVILAIFAIFSLANVMAYIDNYEHVGRAIDRLEKIGHESDDSAHGRGYTRITNNPEYLLVGAGEGGYYRFHEFSKALELHSGIGTIVFCYGLIGTALFFLLLYTVQARNYLYIGYIIFLVLLYGIVHQNIRFSHFWVFLGVCEGVKHVYYQNRNKTRKASTRSG